MLVALRALNGIRRQIARSSALFSSSIKPGNDGGDVTGKGLGKKLPTDLHPTPLVNGPASDLDPVRVREESVWHRDRGTASEQDVLADRSAVPGSMEELQAETLEHLQENEENPEDKP